MENYLFILCGLKTIVLLTYGIVNPQRHKILFLGFLGTTPHLRKLGIGMIFIGFGFLFAAVSPVSTIGWIIAIIGGLFASWGIIIVVRPRWFSWMIELERSFSPTWWRVRCTMKSLLGVAIVVWGLFAVLNS